MPISEGPLATVDELLITPAMIDLAGPRSVGDVQCLVDENSHGGSGETMVNPSLRSPFPGLHMQSSASGTMSLTSSESPVSTPHQMNTFVHQNGWIVIDFQRDAVVICLQCKSIFNPAKTSEHVVKYHKDVNPDSCLQAQFNSIVLADYPNLTFSPDHPKTPVPYVRGLDLKTELQFCPICSCGFSKDPGKNITEMLCSFRKHSCGGSNLQLRRTFVVMAGQCFGKTFSWFVITSIPIPAIPSSLWSLYQAKMAVQPSVSEAVSIPQNYHVLDQFLHKERWLEHVSAVNVSTAMDLVSYSLKDPKFGGLHRRIHAFLAELQSKTRSYSLRRLIGTRLTSEHSHSYQRHHSDVNFETHKRYVLVMAGMLVLLMWNIKELHQEYLFHVPANLRMASNAVLSAMLLHTPSLDAKSLYDEVESGVDAEDSDNEDDFPDNQPLPDILDDVLLIDDIGSSAFDAIADTVSFPYGMTETWKPPVFHDKAQELLKCLLYMLFTQNLNDGQDNPFQSVLTCYIVLSSLTASGSWHTGSTITQKIAAILFLGRLVIADEILWLKLADSTLSYTK
jgi:hypothetical protein